jgi:hypothetical protein
VEKAMTVMTKDADRPASGADWAAKPASFLVWWVLPPAAAWASDWLLPGTSAWVWSIALAWMGLGCALNAYRCHRLHCFISAPAFLLGAGAAALIASGAVAWGPHALGNVTSAVIVIVALSFLPEWVWRKYV